MSADQPNPELDLETLGIFVEESEEALARMEKQLLDAEVGTVTPDLMSSLFRDFHTIKGTSGFLGLRATMGVSHAAEDLLSRLRDKSLAAQPAHYSCLLEVVDLLRGLLGRIKEHHDEGTIVVAPMVERLRAMASADARAVAAPPPVAAPAAPVVTAAPAAPTNPAPPTESAAAPAPVRESHPEAAVRGEGGDGTVRVQVGILDRLMNLVGELVLARNQMSQAVKSCRDDGGVAAAASQRLNTVTGELQDQVMKTRLQPVGRVFEKIPRMVRDLCQTTGKRVEVEIHGTETEIDKALIEAIRDPVMHIIRNSVDHGIEPPEAREAVGKPATGRVSVRAGHEGGLVMIEIEDDGGGIDPVKVRAKAVKMGLLTAAEAERLSVKESIDLIFRPGFTTASAVTNISGRGVGMDVVRTHVERSGGQVEIESVVGKGTTLRMKMPLTLAIIPALLVRAAGQRFAIPQANLLELVYLDDEQGDGQIARLRGTTVYRLRGELVPVVRLDHLLGLSSDSSADQVRGIVVVAVGARRYGLAIDDIQDTEEIVVKPLDGALKRIACYSGATVLGDGGVALILDVLGIAALTGIDVSTRPERARIAEPRRTGLGPQPHLIFMAGANQQCAVSLSGVARLEQVNASAIERVAGREVLQYRGGIMPVIRPEAAMPIGAAVDNEGIQQLVVFDFGQPVAMAATSIVDIVQLQGQEDTPPGGLPYLLGETVVGGLTTVILDVYAIVRHLAPYIAGERPKPSQPRARILLVDDSNAMRSSIGGYLRSQGLEVLEISSGQAALDHLRVVGRDTFHAVVTDLEMAGLDGRGLLAAIRREQPQLPVIVWTHHDDPALAKTIREGGAIAFVNKMRREELVQALSATGLSLPDAAFSPTT